MYLLSRILVSLTLAASCFAGPLFPRGLSNISIDSQPLPTELAHFEVPSNVTSAGPIAAPNATLTVVHDNNAFLSSNLSIAVYGYKGCLNSSNNIPPIPIDNGINYHALIASYQLSRDLLPNEQLDFSTWGNPGNSGVDRQCAKPVESVGTPVNSQTLKAGCYNTMQDQSFPITVSESQLQDVRYSD